MILSTHGIYAIPQFTPDTDAKAYFDALAISTNQTMQDGSTLTPIQILVLIDRFFRDLKGVSNPNYTTSNMYSAFDVLRLNIGGTATQNKWNAKNPADSDGAYRAIYGGSGITHNAWGVLHGGGSYENSKLNWNTRTNNDFSIGAYINGGIAQNAIAFGANAGAGNGGTICYARYGDGKVYVRAQSSVEKGGFAFGALGMVQLTSFNDGANKIRYTNNTTVQLSTTDTKTTVPSLEMWFGGQNNNGVLYAPTTFRLGYCYITNRALSTTEETNHYNAVQALQTGLKRNV